MAYDSQSCFNRNMQYSTLLLLKPDLHAILSEKRGFIASWVFTGYPTIEASICIGVEKDIL